MAEDFEKNCNNCTFFNKETSACEAEVPFEYIENPTGERCGFWASEFAVMAF